MGLQKPKEKGCKAKYKSSGSIRDIPLWERTLRASILVGVQFSKIQKSLHFTHFGQKNTHISGCKIVYLYTIATVTVHICMITVARVFDILLLIFSLLPLTLISTLSFSFHHSSFFLSSQLCTAKPISLFDPTI